jgi:hypothetical protein
MNSKMYHDMESYYKLVLKMNLAQNEYEYKVQLNKDSNAMYTNCEIQKQINDEYLNKLKSDMNISKLEVERFKKGIREFMVEHPNIKYPID